MVKNEGFSVLQGFTTENTTQLTIDAPKKMKLNFRLVNQNRAQIIEPHSQRLVGHKKSAWAVHKIAFSGLSLGVSYLFHILDKNGNILEERVLKTLDTLKPNPKIAVISCMLDYAANIKKHWDTFDKSEPDICFFIGDVTYGDILAVISGPNLLWYRFITTRRKVPFYHRRHLIPVHGIWDDHDYGKNNADYNYKHKNDSLRTFNTFFAQEPVPGKLQSGPGLASSFDAFGQRFIFLDNRWFLNKVEDGKKVFWGEEQRQWAFPLIEKSNLPIWLIQGCQFFGDYANSGQSPEGKYQWELDLLAKSIRSAKMNTVLVGGDVHYSEIHRIEPEFFGQRTFEITSSSMHSFRPGPVDVNPRRQNGYLGNNFITVEIEPTLAGSLLNTKCLSDGEVKFNTYLDIY
jgi:hypothetical protein